eukprot:Sspe_Gene.67204::Locus_39679_Transcript_1_1_Confidence_1.000_Length_1295::g.67204::m.67204
MHSSRSGTPRSTLNLGEHTLQGLRSLTEDGSASLPRTTASAVDQTGLWERSTPATSYMPSPLTISPSFRHSSPSLMHPPTPAFNASAPYSYSSLRRRSRSPRSLSTHIPQRDATVPRLPGNIKGILEDIVGMELRTDGAAPPPKGSRALILGDEAVDDAIDPKSEGWGTTLQHVYRGRMHVTVWGTPRFTAREVRTAAPGAVRSTDCPRGALQLVLLCVGVGDALSEGPVPLSEYSINLIETIRVLRSRGHSAVSSEVDDDAPAVIVMAPPPASPFPHDPSNQTVMSYSAAAKGVAEQARIDEGPRSKVFFLDLFTLIWHHEALPILVDMERACCLTREGHALVADAVLRLLSSYLPSLLPESLAPLPTGDPTPSPRLRIAPSLAMPAEVCKAIDVNKDIDSIIATVAHRLNM